MNKCKSQCFFEGCYEDPVQYTNYNKFHKICQTHLNCRQDYGTCRVCKNQVKVLRNHDKLQIYKSHANYTHVQVNSSIQNKLINYRCELHKYIEQNINEYLTWKKCKNCYCYICNKQDCYIACNQLNICFNPCTKVKLCQCCGKTEGCYYLMKDDNQICEDHSFCENDYKTYMKEKCWFCANSGNYGADISQGHLGNIYDPNHGSSAINSSLNNFSSEKSNILSSYENSYESYDQVSHNYPSRAKPQNFEVYSKTENNLAYENYEPSQINEPNNFTAISNINENYYSNNSYISQDVSVEGLSRANQSYDDDQEKNKVFGVCDSCNTEKHIKMGSCSHYFCTSCIQYQQCLKCTNCYYCKNTDFNTFSNCDHKVCSRCLNGFNKCIICYYKKVCELCRNQEILCTHGYCIHLVNETKCQACYCCYNCGARNVSLNFNDCVHPRCDNCINNYCKYCHGNKCKVCKKPQIRNVCNKFLHGFCKDHESYSCIYCEPCKNCRSVDQYDKCLHGFCITCRNFCQDCLCFACKKKTGKFKNRNNYLICDECINSGNCENCFSFCDSCSLFKEIHLLKCSHYACLDCYKNECKICELKTFCKKCEKKIISINPTCIHRCCNECSKNCCKPEFCRSCGSKSMILNACGHFKCPHCTKSNPLCNQCYEAECVLCNKKNIEKLSDSSNICIECNPTQTSRNIKCKVCFVLKEFYSVCIHRVCLDCSICEKCKSICELCSEKTNNLCKKCRHKLCKNWHT